MASKTDALNFMGVNYFVLDPVPEDLICPICHELLNVPVQTPCGHLFCKECFIQARLIQSEETPEKTSNSTKNRKRKKGKNAYCPLCRVHFKGEPYTDKYNERRVKSLKVKCPNSPCSWTGMLSSNRQHRADEKGCKYEVVSCPKGCTEKIHRVHLKTHIELKCIYREKSCEHCGLTVPIDQLQEHYQMCVEVPVCCPNECGEKTLHQHAVEDHLELCPGQVIHCPYHTLGCEDVIMRKYIHAHQEEAKGKHLELALKKVVKLSEAVSVLSLNFTRISQQYRELSQSTATRDADTVDTSQYTQVAVRSWLKNTTHFPSMPWIVKMDNIPANTKWYSKPFYTSLTGYKLCLLVCLNSSEDKDDSQYISVFTVLMPGPNDNILPFPYKGTMNVVILNHLEDRYHHTCEVEYSKAPVECGRRVQEGAETWGWGDTKFKSVKQLKKSEVQNSQYLKDNCLYFKIEQK